MYKNLTNELKSITSFQRKFQTATLRQSRDRGRKL